MSWCGEEKWGRGKPTQGPDFIHDGGPLERTLAAGIGSAYAISFALEVMPPSYATTLPYAAAAPLMPTLQWLARENSGRLLSRRSSQ